MISLQREVETIMTLNPIGFGGVWEIARNGGFWGIRNHR